MPIGIYDMSNTEFTTKNIPLLPDDTIYMYSDGYADQFGGPNNKKFKYTQLKEVLLSIHKLPLIKQKNRLEKIFLDWKGSNQQIDDVMILGYKV
jgi:serine phosphatase RsbU (regulator of sigma subunit)